MSARIADALSAQLLERADVIAADVLHNNRSALASMADQDRTRMETIVRTVAARLLQEPLARLGTLDEEPIPAVRIAALRELFGLDGEDA
jgi:hypothetical protein